MQGRPAGDHQASAPIIGLNHAQAAAPVGSEGEARAFYGELIGLPEIEKPEASVLAVAFGSPAARSSSTSESPTTSHLQPRRIPPYLFGGFRRRT